MSEATAEQKAIIRKLRPALEGFGFRVSREPIEMLGGVTAHKEILALRHDLGVVHNIAQRRLRKHTKRVAEIEKLFVDTRALDDGAP